MRDTSGKLEKLHFSTRAIHTGQTPDKETGAIVPPVHQTSTFYQKNFAEYDFDYSRADNPTRRNLEENIASLEEGIGAVAFGSGMAAESAVFSLFSQGDHIILSENVYGGTYRVMDKIFNRFGLTASWVDTSDISAVKNNIQSNTKLIFIETPTNPMMQLSDIRKIAVIADKHKIILAVDNTFMSPYFQRPLTLGAQIVVHSTTKYLNGHSDVVGGIVITTESSLLDDLQFIQMSVGGIPSPQDCWLTQRSLKTLTVRLKEHNRNAMKLAQILEDSGAFQNVYYPGLESHPQHELASSQQLDPHGNPGYGGMISVELVDLPTAAKFVKGLSIFTLAESLGGVESLVCHPATMTHASVPEEKRQALGISDGLVRLSVGIENIEDLVNDVESSLKSLM
ncbi:MAG: PLP-dependent transferase [Candidatus Marinimicrobia bacterium]|jgi:cystathionine beta-lyase/cystathionine gamma-synthase|nr:PLP-dependent transferase [Candidatus Neomarinimicrobiota bacterium]MBT3632723.1 PLP-dependent transferase [Candidatus Neomarinimicrobiota bacterium]MBT3681833.1 PLP-dependent transferase [Candidatus Neomarinimicrobiota bacterium]MBT3760534.1 PLP-dependent transferase [Candidatus Neomarinimicrobiota bacterium]MBT3896680.1 PLP-dependent transferase [Candidatus Neomarinimicrobiota bacterium]